MLLIIIAAVGVVVVLKHRYVCDQLIACDIHAVTMHTDSVRGRSTTWPELIMMK